MRFIRLTFLKILQVHLVNKQQNCKGIEYTLGY